MSRINYLSFYLKKLEKEELIKFKISKGGKLKIRAKISDTEYRDRENQWNQKMVLLKKRINKMNKPLSKVVKTS